jgi:hypothetical protein
MYTPRTLKPETKRQQPKKKFLKGEAGKEKQQDLLASYLS